MSVRSRHSTVDDQLQSVSQASPTGLRRIWTAELGSQPPRLPADLLARALAYELQAQALGGLPAKLAKQLQVHLGSGPMPHVPATKAANVLAAGSILIRSWGGTTYTVLVEDSGYLLNGRSYGSLSQIATEITGTRWSGPRFFGLKQARGNMRHA